MRELDSITPVSSKEKLIAYLTKRIEAAAVQNNLMANNPFQFLNGLIDAISYEKEVLENELHAISTQFKVSEAVVQSSIGEALNQVYNQYLD